MSAIYYTNIDTDRLVIEEVKPGKITDKNGNSKGQFSTLRTKYNVGTPESPIVRSFVVEGPIGTSNFGIQEQENESGSKSYTIRYKPDNLEEAEAFYEKMKLLKARAAKALFDNRRHKDMHHVKPTSKEETILDNMRDIMYIPTDDFGVRLPDSVPSKFLNLDTGSYNPIFRTKFQRVAGLDVNGEPIMEEIPWELLYGMRVTFVPHLSFYRIYSGIGSKSFQCKLRSAIVTDIQKPKEKNPHFETAKKLVSNPEYLKHMNESLQLAQKMAEARARGDLDEDGNISPSQSLSRSPSTPPVVVDPMAAVKAVTNIPSLGSDSQGISSTTVTSSLTDFMTSKPQQSDSSPMLTKIPDLPTMPGMPSIAS